MWSLVSWDLVKIRIFRIMCFTVHWHHDNMTTPTPNFPVPNFTYSYWSPFHCTALKHVGFYINLQNKT